MNAVILIPYRAAGAERERNYARVRAFWDPLVYPVFTADSGHEYFTCSVSRNQAAAAAGAWDVAIFTDADILLGDPRQAEEALAVALETGAFTVAYDEFRWLGPEETQKVCDGLDPLKSKPLRSMGRTWISTFAIRRDLFDQAGRFDERFLAYGKQDIAFYKAAATLGGTRRIAGPLYHLDHPRRPDEERLPENWERELLYDAAYGDRDRMLALIGTR